MFVHVAVPVPGLDLLTYAVPAGVDPPAVGARVVVPLGSRIVTGIVIERNTGPVSHGVDVKPVRQVLDAGSFVPPEVVALARWTADYYAAGVGDTIPALLPPMARGGRADAHKTTRMAAITAQGLEALEASEVEGRQLEGLQILSGSPAGIATSVLAARGIAAAAISRLARRGYISLRQDRVDRDPLAVSPPPAAVSTAGSDPGLTRVRP